MAKKTVKKAVKKVTPAKTVKKAVAKLTDLVINRGYWLTGEVVAAGVCDTSALRDKKTGFMCCLGFGSLQAGLTAKQITGLHTPSDFARNRKAGKLLRAAMLLEHDVDYATAPDAALAERDRVRSLIDDAMENNDDDTLTRKQREAAIKRTLGLLGYRVKFVGKYPNYEKLAEAVSGSSRQSS
jgi:hypothetical protein